MIDETLLEAEEKMDKALEVAKEDFSAIRTGRATPALFNKVLVDYYGSPTPLQQLASFQVPEARTVIITPYDRTSLTDIEKSLRASDLGVNPTNDGTIIRIALPQLTQERRKEYVKVARTKAEDARVSVRSVRRRAPDRGRSRIRDRQGRRGRRGRRCPRREGAGAGDEASRRCDRRAAAAQGDRAP